MSEAGKHPGYLVFLVPEYPPIIGGSGQVVADLVEALPEDFPFIVLTAGTGAAPALEIKGQGRIVRMRIPFRLPLYFDATNLSLLVYTCKTLIHGLLLARRHRVRAIHAFHVLPTGLAAWALARLLGVNFHVTAIGAEIHDPVARRSILRHPLYRRLVRFVLERAAGVTAISRAIAAAAAEYAPGRDIRVISPGLNLRHAIPEKRSHAGIVLCTLCRLAPRKGLETALEALAGLDDLPLRFVILGDGPSRAALEAQAQVLGLGARVEFTGFVSEEEKFARLSQADIFVLPSLYEGFGITYLEAMACGLPIIAGGEGGQLDFLEDGRNAVLLRDRRVETLREALRALCGDAALRASMGAANRLKAAGYRMDRIAARYLELYGPGRA